MKKLFLCIVAVIMLMFLMATVAMATDGGASSFDFWAYITSEAYILVPVLYVLGVLAKRIPNIPDWVIPFGLLIIAIPVAMALSGWALEGALQGVLVTGVTVLANQGYKQLKERE